jgi:hypothetical protein
MTALFQASLLPGNDEAIRFYCGVGEKHYNHHPVVTGPYACVSPVSGSEVKKVTSVAVPASASVLQDSGAFNDACLLLRGHDRHLSLMKQHRLTFVEAIKCFWQRRWHPPHPFLAGNNPWVAFRKWDHLAAPKLSAPFFANAAEKPDDHMLVLCHLGGFFHCQRFGEPLFWFIFDSASGPF